MQIKNVEQYSKADKGNERKDTFLLQAEEIFFLLNFTSYEGAISSNLVVRCLIKHKESFNFTCGVIVQKGS